MCVLHTFAIYPFYHKYPFVLKVTLLQQTLAANDADLEEEADPTKPGGAKRKIGGLILGPGFIE